MFFSQTITFEKTEQELPTSWEPGKRIPSTRTRQIPTRSSFSISTLFFFDLCGSLTRSKVAPFIRSYFTHRESARPSPSSRFSLRVTLRDRPFEGEAAAARESEGRALGVHAGLEGNTDRWENGGANFLYRSGFNEAPTRKLVQLNKVKLHIYPFFLLPSQ